MTLLKLGIPLIVFAAMLPGCGGSASQDTSPPDDAAPVVDPENSKDGIERVKHIDT